MSGLFGEAVERARRKSVEWYTPGWVFERLGLVFDLDPCHPADCATAVPARRFYTVHDNGLAQPWAGRVWLNPPYGPETAFWMRRLCDHGDGVALVFSRTDAAWMQEAMAAATTFVLLRGRIAFVPGAENAHKASTAGAGSALLAFGAICGEAVAMRMAELGFLVDNRQ